MRLFLLFLIVPLIEIALFIQVGGIIGLGWTLLIVVLTAILGTFLVRSQGLAVLAKLRVSMEELRDPTEPLVHGAMILFSGALLLTPGFFTDAVGFCLLVPGIRRMLFNAIRARFTLSEVRYGTGERPQDRPDIVDAEFEDLGPEKGKDRPSGWTRH
jgi:UPF0716 protein FxsA